VRRQPGLRGAGAIDSRAELWPGVARSLARVQVRSGCPPPPGATTKSYARLNELLPDTLWAEARLGSLPDTLWAEARTDTHACLMHTHPAHSDDEPEAGITDGRRDSESGKIARAAAVHRIGWFAGSTDILIGPGVTRRGHRGKQAKLAAAAAYPDRALAGRRSSCPCSPSPGASDCGSKRACIRMSQGGSTERETRKAASLHGMHGRGSLPRVPTCTKPACSTASPSVCLVRSSANHRPVRSVDSSRALN
jgi:hypothetical protein